METIENGFGGRVHDGVPDLLVTEKNLLLPQLWTGRRQLFHISLPLLRCSLICQVLPAPMSFRRTVGPTVTGYRALRHL